MEELEKGTLNPTSNNAANDLIMHESQPLPKYLTDLVLDQEISSLNVKELA
jgi:hypothetical protein